MLLLLHQSTEMLFSYEVWDSRPVLVVMLVAVLVVVLQQLHALQLRVTFCPALYAWHS